MEHGEKMSKSNTEEVIGLLQAILAILLIQDGYSLVGVVFSVFAAISFSGSVYYAFRNSKSKNQEVKGYLR